MKCGELNPESTYVECDRELLHDGAHARNGRKWPRTSPAELPEDIADLLEKTRPGHVWDVDERKFPVLVEVTTTYVVWVDAESEDEALDQLDGAEGDLDLSRETAIEGDLEVQRLGNTFLRAEVFRSRHAHRSKVGPRIACPDCGRLAFRREWFHNPYRKCHGPIVWFESSLGRPLREHQATPVHTAEAVSAR